MLYFVDGINVVREFDAKLSNWNISNLSAEIQEADKAMVNGKNISYVAYMVELKVITCYKDFYVPVNIVSQMWKKMQTSELKNYRIENM